MCTILYDASDFYDHVVQTVHACSNALNPEFRMGLS